MKIRKSNNLKNICAKKCKSIADSVNSEKNKLDQIFERLYTDLNTAAKAGSYYTSINLSYESNNIREKVKSELKRKGFIVEEEISTSNPYQYSGGRNFEIIRGANIIETYILYISWKENARYTNNYPDVPSELINNLLEELKNLPKIDEDEIRKRQLADISRKYSSIEPIF